MLTGPKWFPQSASDDCEETCVTQGSPVVDGATAVTGNDNVDGGNGSEFLRKPPAAVARVRRLAATATKRDDTDTTTDDGASCIMSSGSSAKHGDVDLSVSCRGVEAGPSIVRKSSAMHKDVAMHFTFPCQVHEYTSDDAIGTRSAHRKSHCYMNGVPKEVKAQHKKRADNIGVLVAERIAQAKALSALHGHATVHCCWPAA